RVKETAQARGLLRQADQLRAGVLNSISHDFRTPLASILGSATTLYEYEQQLTPAVRRDLMRSIQEDAERLNAHVGALLDMGRLEGGALKPREEWVDVRELIGSAIRRLAARLGDHKIERDFADRLSLVKADPTLVEQAILNLLDNAAVHTPAGGTLRIAAHEDGRWVMVSVDDEGPGVPADQQAAIFDKFRRGPSDRTGGLGLGLSITKGFVEAMGGRVALVSPLGPSGGSRFMISLGKVAETPRGLL
ncbi:MAG TPA: ATP-binding protein, partial [Phenylobacterium sp.]|nr:ATP-binding protein [Phenylobacterium sp.]